VNFQFTQEEIEEKVRMIVEDKVADFTVIFTLIYNYYQKVLPRKSDYKLLTYEYLRESNIHSIYTKLGQIEQNTDSDAPRIFLYDSEFHEKLCELYSTYNFDPRDKANNLFFLNIQNFICAKLFFDTISFNFTFLQSLSSESRFELKKELQQIVLKYTEKAIKGE
jgi:hypothetical protein